MAKKKLANKQIRSKWSPFILVAIIALILITLIYVFSKSNFSSKLTTINPTPTSAHQQFKLTSKPDMNQTVNWSTYNSPEYGMEFKYPTDWSVSYDSYTFPQKDLVLVSGNNTNEGSYFSVANPIRVGQKDDRWFPEGYQIPDGLETEVVNGLDFKKEFNAGQVCQTHYYLSKNGYIFEFILSTYCNEKSKEESDQTLINILNTLKFSN